MSPALLHLGLFSNEVREEHLSRALFLFVCMLIGAQVIVVFEKLHFHKEILLLTNPWHLHSTTSPAFSKSGMHVVHSWHTTTVIKEGNRISSNQRVPEGERKRQDVFMHCQVAPRGDLRTYSLCAHLLCSRVSVQQNDQNTHRDSEVDQAPRDVLALSFLWQRTMATS